MADTVIVYVSIGNSDDKLSQADWAEFYHRADVSIDMFLSVRHGRWLSAANEPWQNACWCFEISADKAFFLKERLRKIAAMYGQESIAWAAATTEFLEPARMRAADHG